MTEPRETGNLALQKLNYILSWPWVRIFSWGLFFALLYSVRGFFTVIFLTFIISYIACNVVNGIAGLFGRWELLRKLVVLVTYAVFLFVAYSGGRFLAPHIVEQGRGVANTVSQFVNRGLDKIIPEWWARWQYSRFEGTRKYQEELEKMRRAQDLKKLSWESFKKYAAKLRADFRRLEVERRGRDALEKARGTDQFKNAFQAYLKERIARETDPAVLERRKREEEAKLLSVLGQSEFENFKRMKGAQYQSWLADKVIRTLIEELPSEKVAQLRKTFEEEFVRKEGEKAVARAEGTPEWEANFKKYYESVQHPPPYDYPYEKFVQLERAPTNEAFVSLWGEETAREQGEQALKRRFKEKKIAEFAKAAEERLTKAGLNDLIKSTAAKVLPTLASWLTMGINYTFTFALHLILSVLFSFIIVWDMPRLRRGVELLAHSRIRRLYYEIVPDLAALGNLMGRAFQAQALIAIANTVLTLLALVLLGVTNRAFLCTIVFICSFIPVAGSVISTVPIALVGLQMGGIMLALKLIGAIILIHFFESWILNPKILGDMLHLHPLLVLIILIVGGHYFGIWGLLLGVPVCVYIIRYVILHGVDPSVLRRLAPKMALAEARAGGTGFGRSQEPPEAPERDDTETERPHASVRSGSGGARSEPGGDPD